MVEVVHTRAKPPLTEGQVYKNPRFFAGPVEGATKATIDPGFPEIEEAYAAVKVPVVIVGRAKPNSDGPAQVRRAKPKSETDAPPAE